MHLLPVLYTSVFHHHLHAMDILNNVYLKEILHTHLPDSNPHCKKDHSVCSRWARLQEGVGREVAEVVLI